MKAIAVAFILFLLVAPAMSQDKDTTAVSDTTFSRPAARASLVQQYQQRLEYLEETDPELIGIRAQVKLLDRLEGVTKDSVTVRRRPQ